MARPARKGRSGRPPRRAAPAADPSQANPAASTAAAHRGAAVASPPLLPCRAAPRRGSLSSGGRRPCQWAAPSQAPKTASLFLAGPRGTGSAHHYANTPFGGGGSAAVPSWLVNSSCSALVDILAARPRPHWKLKWFKGPRPCSCPPSRTAAAAGRGLMGAPPASFILHLRTCARALGHHTNPPRTCLLQS